MKCLNNIPDIYTEMQKIISLLAHIDLKHIKELIEAISEMFNLVMDILEKLKPWDDNSSYID